MQNILSTTQILEIHFFMFIVIIDLTFAIREYCKIKTDKISNCNRHI